MLITQQWHIYRDGLIVAWSRPRHLRLISIHVKYRSGQNNRNIPFRREKRNAEPFIPFLLKFWLFRLIPSDPARVQTCRLQIRPTQMGYPARPGLAWHDKAVCAVPGPPVAALHASVPDWPRAQPRSPFSSLASHGAATFGSCRVPSRDPTLCVSCRAGVLIQAWHDQSDGAGKHGPFEPLCCKLTFQSLHEPKLLCLSLILPQPEGRKAVACNIGICSQA